MVPLPCHERRPIAQINQFESKKKKTKKKNHFNFPPSLSFSRRRKSLHPSFCANFFLKFHRYTLETLFHTDPFSFDSISRPLACFFSVSPFLSLLFLLTLFVIIIDINFLSLSLSLCGLVGSMLQAEEFCCRRHTVRQS